MNFKFRVNDQLKGIVETRYLMGYKPMLFFCIPRRKQTAAVCTVVRLEARKGKEKPDALQIFPDSKTFF